MKNKKKFDCVEMMHQGALAIYEKTKNMTFDEQVEYWRKRSEAFRKKVGRAKRKKAV